MKSAIRLLVAIVLAIGCLYPTLHAATGTLLPQPWFSALDASGNPISGAKACFYVAGTSTPATTFSDVALSISNSNPVTADSAGRIGPVYLTPGQSYKLILQDATGTAGTCNGATVRTQDNIAAIPTSSGTIDITGTVGEALTAGNVVYLSDGSGGKTAGFWYKADSAATYSSTTPEVGIVPSSITSGASGTIRIAGSVTGLSSLSVGSDYFVSTAGGLTTTAPTNVRLLGRADTATSLVLFPAPKQVSSPNICDCRLTLTSGTPVTTSDVTAATNMYLTPYRGNRIALYDTSGYWTVLAFAELTQAIGTVVPGQAYDLFAYNNAGVVATELLEWANATITMTIAAPGVVTWTGHGLTTGQQVAFTTTGALPTGVSANTVYYVTTVDANSFKLSTTAANLAAGTFITTTGTQSGTHTGHAPYARQTALVLQDGVYVKSGATTRRYLGTFAATSTTTTEDSLTKRYVWNMYNRVPRTLLRQESTDSWTYNAAAYQQANASPSNQVEAVIGLAEVELQLSVQHYALNNTGDVQAAVAIGEDSTTTADTKCVGMALHTSTQINGGTAFLRKYPAIGRRVYTWLEKGPATNVTTWYGDNGDATKWQSGISGRIEG